MADSKIHVQTLDQRIEKLRSSLSYWQQWYLEYASLKEHVEANSSGPQQLAHARQTAQSSVIGEKELDEIFGPLGGKTPAQVRLLLARRLQYVERNVDTLQKQLDQAEEELFSRNGVDEVDESVAGSAATATSTSIPITDIIEELDDDGNITNVCLQSGRDAGLTALEALGKVDLKNNTGSGPRQQQQQHQSSPPSTQSPPQPPGPPQSSSLPPPDRAPEARKPDDVVASRESNSTPSQNTQSSPAPSSKKSSVAKAKAKRRVGFTADTKPGHDDAGCETRAKSKKPKTPLARLKAMSSTSPYVRNLEQIMKAAADQAASSSVKGTVVPDNEVAEDAELRREMLKYGMSEIAPVVAELEIEEGDGGGPDDDSDWIDDDKDESNDDDSEDEFGRSKHSVITDDYRRQMEELEKRLGVKSSVRHEARDKDDDDDDGDFLSESLGRILVKDATQDSARAILSTVKDIKRDGSDVEPPSTFLPLPAPPENKAIADTIFERAPPAQAAPPDPCDPALLMQQTAVEYHRMRNRFIQKDGGFLQDTSSPIEPLGEEEGGPKRVSRFMAGRLKGISNVM